MGSLRRLLLIAAQMLGGGAGMEPRRRRRLDVVLLAIAGLLVGAVAAIGAVLGDSERVSALWAGADVAGQGNARVVEVIDYDFGSEQRRGIFRDVPGLASDAEVLVASATAPDDVWISGYESLPRIRIGDPARTIGGRHRYRIQYPLDAVAPGGRLAWDAVGTEWLVGISNVEVHAVAPFEFQGARCVQGQTGSQQRCDIAQPEPGHLVVRIRALDPGEGATLYATAGRRLEIAPALPVPSSTSPVDPTSGVLRAGLLAVVVALVGGGVTSRLVRRAGRERVAAGGAAAAAFAGSAEEAPEVRVDIEKLASLATVEFTPPPGLTPSQGGVVLDEGVQEEHQVAWLIAAAADGYLDIEGDRQAVTLVRLPHQDGSATTRTLDTAFAGDTHLTLGTYRPSFATAWRQIGEDLAAWHRSRGNLWDPAGDRRRTQVRLLGGLAATGGLFVAGLGGALVNSWGWAWLAVLVVGALVAGAGLAAVVRGWELRTRTPEGSGLWLRIESFRRFLAASEAHHAEEAAKRGVVLEYTAWAVALGELDHWSRAVTAAAVDPVTVGYATMAPLLWSDASASTMEPVEVSSGGGDGGWSGGGGGSGGGGVGGGSGGGGGGSW
jgi:uncharacterized membrane protein YgcG